jgi:hypothetical protein
MDVDPKGALFEGYELKLNSYDLGVDIELADAMERMREPASVEQQRHLGKTAPSLYDLRNVFQVNVEEARHLWAMVHLLHKYFGSDGREEAEQPPQRRSGGADKPRMLGAFNEVTPVVPHLSRP